MPSPTPSADRTLLSRTRITLSNVLAVLLAPGVVVHELSHAATCRLLGIDVTEVVLFEWPTDFTRDRGGSGYVQQAGTPPTWQAALVSVAPLAVNTVGALAGFTAASQSLAGSLFEPGYVGLASFVAVLVDRFLALGLGRQAVVTVGLWLGCAFAFTGFPSEADLRVVGRRLGGFGWLPTGSDTLGAVLSHVRDELASLYVLHLALVGLFGVGVAFTSTDVYLEFLLLGLPLLFLRLTRRRTDRVPDRPRDESARARRLSNRAAAGELLDRGDVDFLVDRLSAPRRRTRSVSADALLRTADSQPDLVGEWAEPILARAETERDPDVHRKLLSVVSRLADSVEPERLVALGADALAADDPDLRGRSLELFAKAALADPTTVAPHAVELPGLFGEVSDPQRGNLLLTLARVAAAVPEAFASGDEPPDEVTHGRDGTADDGTRSGARADLVRRAPDDVLPVVDLLVRGLDDEADAVRVQAVTGLGYVGRAHADLAGPVVDVLAALLDAEGDDAVRSAAVKALSRVADEQPAAVTPLLPRLVGLLEDGDGTVREKAGITVSRVADGAPGEVEPLAGDLVALLADENDSVRSSAALALSRTAEDHPDVLRGTGDALLALLEDDYDRARTNATSALSTLAETDPDRLRPATDRLVARLADDHDPVRANVASTLANLAREYPGVVAGSLDELRPLLSDPHESVRLNAASAFAIVARSHPGRVRPAVDALRDCLVADGAGLRENAAEALAGVADAYPAAVLPARERLVTLLADADDDVRAHAARALAALATAFPLAVAPDTAPLVEALADPDERVREAARTALVSTVPDTGHPVVRNRSGDAP